MPSVIHPAIVFLITALIALPQPQYVFAQDRSAGRYTMHQADNGFLRLDTHTGQVAHCRKIESWTCTPVKDAEQATDRQQITRLQQENITLKQYIQRLETLLAENGVDGALAHPPKLGAKMPAFRLPSEQEVEKTLDYFENVLRKFQERLKRLDKDIPQEPEVDKAL